MGKWVIFIGDRGFDLDTIRAMSFAGKTEVRDYGQKQLDVLFREGYVSFRFDDDGWIRNDYPPETLQRLPYAEPRFILMRYSTQELLEKIVSSDDFPKDILIDCDGLDLGLERLAGRARLLDSGGG